MLLVGETARVKSESCTDSGSVAVIVLVLVAVNTVVVEFVEVLAVPVTVKLSGDEVTALRFPTVSVVDWPGVTDAGTNVHVAGAMPVQPRIIDPVNPSVVDAVTVNCAWSVPVRTVTELGFAVRLKGGAPVPVSVMV